MKLHIFNPGHDEALAAGSPYYTYTRAARKLMTDLWMLPRLWAEPGDITICLEALSRFSRWDEVSAIVPWGWDAALVQQLKRAGAPTRLLPDADRLNTVRQFSSRKTAVELLAAIDKPDAVASVFLHDWESVAMFAEKHDGALAKAPWSCSGRGLVHLDGHPSETQRLRVENILKRQGAVAVEIVLKRTSDFAMEFYAEADGTVRFLGLSLFFTDPAGRYLGNLIASDETILSRLAAFPFKEIKHQVCSRLEQTLSGRYIGPIGVDMLQFRVKERGWVFTHPCVEINFRHTMGSVSLALRHLLPSPEKAALFRIGPATTETDGNAQLLCGNPHGLGAWYVDI